MRNGLYAIAALLMLAAMPAQAALNLTITQGVEGATPVAVVPFSWTGSTALGQKIDEIVRSDLALSGEFSPLDTAKMRETPHDSKSVNYGYWRSLNQDYVVVGKVQPAGQGVYKVQFQLLDVYKKKQLSGHSLTVREKNLRRAAHKISDIIYERLTGVPGAFATKVAYVTLEQNGDKVKHKLNISDIDGYNAVNMLSSNAPIMAPAWSPDGKKLAYVSFENKHSEVFIQELSTGKREVVASFKGSNAAPAWSPDGKSLALSLSKDGNAEIYILKLAGNQLQRLTRNRAIDTEPVWAPDGQTIYFTSDRSGGPQIYKASVSGGYPKRVTFEGSYNARPSISNDGQSLVMVHRGQTGFTIAVKNLNTGTLREVTDGRLDESPSIAPNGSMVIYAATSGGRQVLSASSIDGRVKHQLILKSGGVKGPAWSPRFK